MRNVVIVDPTGQDVMHLASTPIAVMKSKGLSTWAGLSGDDPRMSRHKNLSFSVILSAYGSGQLLGRCEIGAIGPNRRMFVCIDDVLENLGLEQQASLCVVHRVPQSFVKAGRISAAESLTRNDMDFTLYRTVVQYGTPDGAFGSVVYETPPSFNRAGRKPHFLSFTNKSYIADAVDNYLVFLNYSVSENNPQEAEVRVTFHDVTGRKIKSIATTIGPYDTGCLHLNEILGSGVEPKTFSISSSSVTASLIPLSIAVSKGAGGVTVEHAHPPQEYFMAERGIVNTLKLRAARYLFGY